jgi:hypothetical protein
VVKELFASLKSEDDLEKLIQDKTKEGLYIEFKRSCQEVCKRGQAAIFS